MKRLLAAGFARIFQICKCFRQAERGRRHLPEMTLLEWYRTQSNYQDLMKECETLINSVAGRIGSEGLLVYQGHQIDLAPPWTRISVKDAFETYSDASLETALQQGRFDDIMVSQIEPQLGRRRPAFLYDYPASRAALAKLKSGDPCFAERFELYIGGVELCNAFSELTDPVEQRTRFEHELGRRKTADKMRYPLPEKFLAAVEDLPEAAGNALGIDRLCMLFADVAQIDEVVAFTPEEL
jgi:lysyl-tRNA synthetase class 2